MNSGVEGLGGMFALRNLLSEGGAPPSVYGDPGRRASGLPGWNVAQQGQRAMDLPPAVTHDFHCTVDSFIRICWIIVACSFNASFLVLSQLPSDEYSRYSLSKA